MSNPLKGRLLTARLILLAASAALIAIGIAAIYAVGSPAAPSPAGNTEYLKGLWEKQLLFAAAGLAGFWAINMVNYRKLGEISYWMYGATLVMLAVLLLDKFIDIPFVPVVNSARCWIRFGDFQFQPSEFCKLAYIIALAWYLRYRSNYRSFNALIGPFGLTVLPMSLILLEPDLGTVMLMMPVLLAMLFIAGAKVKHLAAVILMMLAVSPLLWLQMKPYQRTRISSVLLQNDTVRKQAQQHPALANLLVGGKFSDSRWENDWGYHLLRSKFAVASGGFTGYGFREGPFIKYNFLPERHNDFIFAVIAHQWGFIGSAAVLGLYVLIIICGLEIATRNSDPFGRLLAIGVVLLFAVEVLVNVSMTLGLTPITGLTLPLVSYGGSSLVVSMMAIGLLNSLGRQWPYNVARKQ